MWRQRIIDLRCEIESEEDREEMRINKIITIGEEEKGERDRGEGMEMEMGMGEIKIKIKDRETISKEEIINK